MSAERRSRAFPRTVRLLKPGDYQYIFKRPVVVSDRLFRVYARRNDAPCRLGLAISRKAAPRAVDRNRIKRHVRSVFRLQRPLWDGELGEAGAASPASVSFIVMARPEAKTASGAALQAAIHDLFNRALRKARSVTED
ncbi:MAG: ribonuclease P protein component [Wenzhouxiangellaceae bacterium]